MVEPICALPPLSESLRDSQGASSVQHRTVIDGMRGPHWGMGLIIYVLCNRWGWMVGLTDHANSGGIGST